MIVLVGAIFTFALAKQEDVPKEQSETYSNQFLSEKTILDRLDLKEYVRIQSENAGVDFNVVKKVLNCESGFHADSIGDHGNSIGLWQIHLPAHPDITRSQALNPIWSTSWALNHIKQDQRNWLMWSCYRK